MLQHENFNNIIFRAHVQVQRPRAFAYVLQLCWKDKHVFFVGKCFMFVSVSYFDIKYKYIEITLLLLRLIIIFKLLFRL